MKIGDILTQQAIIPELHAGDKLQALTELVAHCARQHAGIDPQELLAVLLEREQLGSTGIGDGVAIPHGKLKGIHNIIALFARSSRGVAYDAMDAKPVHLFFLLVTPENSAGIHLKALARLSRLLKSAGFRQKLIESADVHHLHDIIVQEDAKHAL